MPPGSCAGEVTQFVVRRAAIRLRLPQHAVRVGAQVVSRDDDDSPTFEVVAISGDVATISKGP